MISMGRVRKEIVEKMQGSRVVLTVLELLSLTKRIRADSKIFRLAPNLSGAEELPVATDLFRAFV